MVFKMLKGFGRLMLTAVLLCSVGLFLCGNVVKADDPDPGVTEVKVDTTGSDITVKFHNGTSAAITLKEAKIKIGGSTFSKTLNPQVEVASGADSPVLYSLPKNDILKDALETVKTTSSIVVTDAIVVSDTDTPYNVNPAKLPAADPVFTVTVKKAIDTKYDTAITSFALNTFTVGGRDYSSSTTDYVGYGLKGDAVVIQTKDQKAGSDAVSSSSYYECINGDSTAKNWYDVDADKKPVFTSLGTTKNATIGEDNLTYSVQYFPKANPITLSNGGDETIYLKNDGTSPKNIEVEFNALTAASGAEKDNTIIKSNIYVKPILTIGTDGNIKSTAWSSTAVNNATKGEIKLTGAVLTADTAPGRAIASVKAVNSNGDDSPLDISASGSINVLAYAALKDITLSNTSVTMLKKGTENVTITDVSPAGADPAIWERVGTSKVTLTYSDSKKIIDQANTKVGNISGKNGLQIAAANKVGTGSTVTLSFTVPETGSVISKTINVTVAEDTSLDPEKSVKNINGSDKNYITVGYELDLATLINSNLVTAEGKTIPKADRPSLEYIEWDDTDKADKYVDGYKKMTDEASKPSLKLKGKAEGTVTFSAILDDGTSLDDISVSIYPMPSAKYSSDHKVTVTVPAKVSTGYGDTDTNINSGKGFKLVMEDSSGNTLYEYDKTKFQSVISSVKDYSTSYAVAATDIEAMVTNAATNGKFTGDTQVKFKVVPMGYKQSTSTEMITAKDEVNAKTDGVQVYQLSSSGTNFANSYAYGLDGQTVNLTATPNTGFTFSKWTDGVTSNPRSIKVSGSGTRAFTPEAKESAAAGGGAAGDNSGLYDDVPKTAESNVAIWLIVFMVFAVMGTAYALYLQLRAATSKNGK